MLAKIAFALAILGLLAAALSGLGHRWQLWSYGTGFAVLTAGVAAAAIGAVLALLGFLFLRRPGVDGGHYFAVAALVIGLLTVIPPLLQLRAARQLPYIHDITTDTENPPAFVAILKERAGAPNSAEYGGAEIAQQQQLAYPDIKPLKLEIAPERAFARAREAARNLGWRIVAEDPAAGRIEASDRTFWYGFVDDVVIRVAPEGGGSRVDVRSVSRVGKSDIGANARRIRAYLREIEPRAAVDSGY